MSQENSGEGEDNGNAELVEVKEKCKSIVGFHFLWS
jgi:hypothetical protein